MRFNERMRTAQARRNVWAPHSLSPMWLNLPSLISWAKFFTASSIDIFGSTRPDWKRSTFFVPRNARFTLSMLFLRLSKLGEEYTRCQEGASYA